MILPGPTEPTLEKRPGLTVEDYVRTEPGALRAIEENMFTSAPSNVDERTPRTASITVNCTGCTPAALNVFNYAASIWSTAVTSTVPISIGVEFKALDPGVLGSAGPGNFFRNFPNAPLAGAWSPVAIANANAGVDLDPSGNDVNSNYSNSFPFYFGTDANPPAGTFDLASVALHEFGHGLGFLGSGRVAGGVGMWGSGTPFPDGYDLFVKDGAGQSILTAYPNNSAALAAVLTGGSLFFNSPASPLPAVAAAVPLYAPNPFEPGSSYSHLDEASFPAGNVNSLMTPQIGQAEAIHQPGAITLAIFSDTGWPGGAPTPPPPPGGLPSMVTNFVCAPVGTDGFNCTWDAVTAIVDGGDRAAATGYTFKARAGGALVLNQPVGNTTMFANPIPVPNGTFVFTVAGTNAANQEGPESLPQTLTFPAGGGPPGCTGAPGQPTGLMAAGPDNTVTLRWTAGVGGCPATAYDVLVAGLGKVAETPATSLTATGPDGTYVVTVVARNGAVPSPPSAPLTVTLPLP